MRPSSWNGVGAMAKVPAALWVSFVMCASGLPPSFRGARSANPEPRDSGFDAAHRPGMTCLGRQTMTNHYDSRETRDPAVREQELFGRLPDVLRAAIKAPAYAERMKGIDPATVTSRAALAALP